MLIVNEKLGGDIRIGKNGPKNVSPLEQRLYRMGYRNLIENKEWKDGKNYRMRYYYRGSKCIKVGNIAHNIQNVSRSLTSK